MKIAVIQASSQKDKNQVLEQCVHEAVAQKGYEVINFGVFVDDSHSYSYVQTAICISLLLESKAVDFVVTGCSSGQGMMLACNSLPGVLCGYIQHPSDAYLFGRINHGNAVSFPLGLNFGWAGELNLQYTMKQLFEKDFGIGYPPEDAARKQADAQIVKQLAALSKRSLSEVLADLDPQLVKSALRPEVVAYLLDHTSNEQLKQTILQYQQ